MIFHYKRLFITNIPYPIHTSLDLHPHPSQKKTFTFLLKIIIWHFQDKRLNSPITSELKRPALWFLPLVTWQVKDGAAAVNRLFVRPCLPFLSSSHHHPSPVGVFPLPVLLLPLPSSPSAAVHSEVGGVGWGDSERERERERGCFEN